MIREEYLSTATRGNLYGIRLTRDVAAVIQTGVRAGATDLLLACERVKIASETLLGKAIALAEGFTGENGDTGFATQYTSNCEARTTLLGVSLRLKLTAAERAVLKSPSLPPVGMRGTLYDSQRALSGDAGEAAAELTGLIAQTSSAQSDGRLLSGFSCSLLGALGNITADYAAAAGRLAAGEEGLMLTRSEVSARLAAEASASVDASEEKLLEFLASNAAKPVTVLGRLAAAAAGGAVKSTFPPLFFDLGYRYSLSVRVKNAG